MSLNLVGISLAPDEAACCLVQDGVIRYAAQEEVFSRSQDAARMPSKSFRFCLDSAGLSITDISLIAIYMDALEAGAGDEVDQRLKQTELLVRQLLAFEGPVEFINQDVLYTASTRSLAEGEIQQESMSIGGGTAVLAAAASYARLTGEVITPLEHVYLGSEHPDEDIVRILEAAALDFADFRGDSAGLISRTAQLLEEGRLVGWFQGRMEFGPRSQGNRSILYLADAGVDQGSIVERLQAMTYEEGLDRAAAVHEIVGLPDHNPLLDRVLKQITGQGRNFSLMHLPFQVHGEPRVESPADAVCAFLSTDLDVLVIGSFILECERNEARFIREVLADLQTPLPPRTLLTESVEEKVGIWRRQAPGSQGEFVRDARNRHEFCHWAQVERIPPKGARTRIGFAGESGARGFLLDPFHNPATCLEELLNGTLGAEEMEVVDIARVSIRLRDLQSVCLQSSLLEPDVLVIYAGDNWRKSLWALNEGEVSTILQSLHEPHRYEVIRAVFEQKSDALIRAFFEKLYEPFILRGIPVIFIIPEFNLQAWKSNESEKTLSWPGEESEEWHALRLQAEELLQAGRFEELSPLAARMVQLNSANPLGYQLLAEVYDNAGMLDEARRSLEKARDTNMYRIGPPPACTSFIREQILKHAEYFGIRTVDLPDRFAEDLEGELPSFNIFLDYCHLNPRGIELAMSYTAEQILQSLGRRSGEVAPSFHRPASETVSKSHFYAAVHSAHIGDQPYEILYYHCKQAITLWPGMTDWFRSFIDLTSRKVPWVLNRQYETVCTKQYVILRQFTDCMVLDLGLARAMTQCLVEEGMDIRAEMNVLRIEQHQPLPHRSVNLLETYYRENSYFTVFSGSKSVDYNSKDQCYYSARSSISTFYLIADPKSKLRGQLTLRGPIGHGHDEDEPVYAELLMNKKRIARLPLFATWSNYSVDIDQEDLSEDGVNELQILWPDIDSITETIHAAYNQSYSGYELFIKRARPAYGDIFRWQFFNLNINE
ncbi:carbamoyltransferase C-terminal domain-containing protein [Paenibacillus aceti]|uniref:Carbamoyltransferase C-terminal domain-containing protein n=1 Tax=Paenibacillus aceti TaxID=1820010 RepID=A0ABQ1VY15_9BACL|nr:carbamoyltransferase C-terminal domain-containing protein [Paenibacillus aceti]GGG03243.1 hypothetical protein GCM10010913_26280 [Paenibacillus aceti]